LICKHGILSIVNNYCVAIEKITSNGQFVVEKKSNCLIDKGHEEE
jgi:hypothetical protein